MRSTVRQTLLILASGLASVVATLPLYAQGPSIGQDLAATIALHGQPCDRIVESKRNSDSDYTASCKDGNRYHVYVDAAGHVVVQKL